MNNKPLVNNICTLKVPIEVLESISCTCNYFQSTEQLRNEDELIVQVVDLETNKKELTEYLQDISENIPAGTSFPEIIKQAREQGCVYLHLIGEVI